jgi:hypothetical protein
MAHFPLPVRRSNLFDQLEQAGPYGSGHSQPVFAIPAHRLKDARLVGTAHIKVTLEAADGSRLEGIAFRAAETPLGNMLLNSRGAQIHAAGCLSADQWQAHPPDAAPPARRGEGAVRKLVDFRDGIRFCGERKWHALGESNPSSQNENLVS